MTVKIIVALCTGTLWMFWNWSFKTTMPIPVIFYRNKKRLLLFDYLGVVSLIWLTLESTSQVCSSSEIKHCFFKISSTGAHHAVCTSSCCRNPTKTSWYVPLYVLNKMTALVVRAPLLNYIISRSSGNN